MNQILFEARTGKSAPVKKSGAARNWISKLLEPVLQPKFAMGMAMTVLSFSMLGQLAGISVRNLKPADLDPVNVWANVDNSAHRGWARMVKYYENLRLVYEIQSRLKEWTDQEEEERRNQQQNSLVPPSGVKKTSGAAK